MLRVAATRPNHRLSLNALPVSVAWLRFAHGIAVLCFMQPYAKLLSVGTHGVSTPGSHIQFSVIDLVAARASLLTGCLLLGISWLAQTRGRLSARPLCVQWGPLTLLMVLSTAYSMSPSNWLRSLNFLGMLWVVAVFAGCPRSSQLYTTALTLCCWIVGIGAVLAIAGQPYAFVNDGFNQQYVGLFHQKGQLAAVSALGAIVASANLRNGQSRWYLLAFAGMMVNLVLAATLTHLLGVLLAIAGQARYRLTLVCTVFLALALPFGFGELSPVFATFGKDPTLTGRALLWQHTLPVALTQPIFGHGFQHISDTSAWHMMLERDFRQDSLFIPHCHNLWLETLYMFGVVGVLTLAWSLIVNPLLASFLTATKQAAPANVDAMVVIWLSVCCAANVPFLQTGFLGVIYVFAITRLTLAGQQLAAVGHSHA